MEDAFPSHAAKEFFTLLSNFANLRHHPDVINTLTPQDEKELDEALKDYKINARKLVEKFIEPLRKDHPAEADYVYDLIRRLIYTSFTIGATTVFSDSTQAFLQPNIVKEHKRAAAANMRDVLAKDPAKEAQKAAEREAVRACMAGKSTKRPYTKARLILACVNQRLVDSQLKTISKTTVGRLIKEIHYTRKD